MKNAWTYSDEPFATWDVALGDIPKSPSDVAALGQEIVHIGEELEVYMPTHRPNYVRRWHDEHVVKLFAPDEAPIGAKLAYYDRSGKVVESVERLGEDPVRHRTQPPLELYSTRLDYDANGTWKNRNPNAGLQVTLYTTGWFPFLPSREARGLWIDNRPLARRHTTRLNAFLARVARSVEARGGVWSLDAIDNHPMNPWLSSAGIALDGPVPDLV
ncbi:MAG TPA: hypothetical protein VGM88_20105 [Kofleriaceae bacterium]|jgi:hypothetical protein